MNAARLQVRVVICLLLFLPAAIPAASVAQAGAGETTRTVTTPEYTVTSARISVPGYSSSTTPGHPQLPVRGELIPLPPGGDWKMIVDSGRGFILPGRFDLPPAASPLRNAASETPTQPSAGGTLPALVMARTPDPAVYGSDAFYPPEPVMAGEVVWQGEQRILPVRFYPFQYNPVTGLVRYYPELTVHVLTNGPANASAVRAPHAAVKSAFGSQSLRVMTADAGMHRLTYSDLLNAGVPDGADTATFAMTYGGAPIDIRLVDADGYLSADDLVIFYAQPYCGRYMKQNVYFFWYGGAPSSNRIAERASAEPADQPMRDWAYNTTHVEYDRAYWSAYPIPSTEDHFFDSPTLVANSTAPGSAITYTLSLPSALTSPNVRFRSQMYGGKAQDAHPDNAVQVLLNSHDLGVFAWDGRVGYNPAATAPAAYLDGSPNQLVVKTNLALAPTVSDYFVYVDWVELDYPAALVASSDRVYAPDLDLGGATSVDVTASGFTTPAVDVYDVREPNRPVLLIGAETTDAAGAYQVRFRDGWDAADDPPRYYLSTQAALLAPAQVAVANAPAWNTPDNRYDYIAIVHRSLWDAIQPLLDKRSTEGYRVAKIDPQHIYDLYSHGRLDPEAIRSFLTYAYLNWNGTGPRPKYVLLVGDGHYDFKNATNTPLANLIPPYLIHVDPWLGETAADNRYVSVNGAGDFLPDMALGRIPAQNATDVTNAVNKILNYEDPARTPAGAWQNMVTFVADQADDPAGNFHAISEDIRLNWLPPSFNSRHIYWESDYTVAYPDMNDAVKAAFADSFLVQWFGHSSKFIWGSTQVFSTFSIPDIPDSVQWPVSIDYSCWTGYFINLYSFYGDYRTMSEAFLLSPGKGSVVAIGPSGQHVGDALQVLNEGFVKSIFTDQLPRAGDAFNAAMSFYYANSTAWPDVIDTTLLFGDPATRLRLVHDAEPPSVSIRRNGTSAIDLTWLHLEPNSAYQVWRGEAPYFQPATEGSQIGAIDGAAYPTGATVTFVDDGAASPPAAIVGDPDRNYFWLARGSNVRTVSADSNRVGEFDFALMRGAP
jgi:hypothetical protein